MPRSVDEMSDSELEANIKLVRAGKSIEWPKALEERISALIDILNQPK